MYEKVLEYAQYFGPKKLCRHAGKSHHRNGQIRKTMRIREVSDSGEECDSVFGIEINTWEKTIDVVVFIGEQPNAQKVFMALLSDRDIRRLLEDYQKSSQIERKTVFSKMDKLNGREDLYIKSVNYFTEPVIIETKRLCQISKNGKLNEELRKQRFFIKVGEFAELVKFLNLTVNMNREYLRKKAGMKYVLPPSEE